MKKFSNWKKRLDLLEKKNVPFTIDEWTVSKISEWRELLKPIIIEQLIVYEWITDCLKIAYWLKKKVYLR